MPFTHDNLRPSRREIFDATLSGAQRPPFIPRLKSDPPAYHPIPNSLVEFREQEGSVNREQRFHRLWMKLPKRVAHHDIDDDDVSRQYPVRNDHALTRESAQRLEAMYEDELLGSCGGHTSGFKRRAVGWDDFQKYAETKEAELWRIFHDELDLDSNGHLEADELAVALDKAGISLSPPTLAEFMTFLTSSPHSHAVSFQEFRDFLLLLPRKASPEEIFRFYEVKKFMGDDGRGAARVNMEGDVSLSAEDMAITRNYSSGKDVTAEMIDHMDHDHDDFEEEEVIEEEHHSWLDTSLAARFLLAGGVAGAVPQASARGFKAIGGAVARIYSEGGVLAFWTGNGLSVAKILPESAIKFMSYETSKRMFAKHWDHVEDSREISGISRFLSGGIGGITSQLSIYPIETLKTQMMSSTGDRRSILDAARKVFALGGVRAFYRGLGIGLIGVFPISPVNAQEEPGVLAILAFGSVSGSVGATSVYPLNLVRTRLQASGSSGHPQRYTGVMDVAQQTYARDGWRGFYRGLFPTLAKVVPAVSISYVVYESTKRKLGV
ncbi:hypothetical protein QCA50_000533 [Cerrena zonata]|uniref:EF-hand domain-containing protein n=1 Tax=Cerrena zonata TaxID=2478898 RepID=A0AAW0GV20_9APHY